MLAPLLARIADILTWGEHWVTTRETQAQLVVVLISILSGIVAYRIIRILVMRLALMTPAILRARTFVKPLLLPILWLVAMTIGMAFCQALDIPTSLLLPLSKLLLAWVLIRGLSLFIGNRDMARIFAIGAWIFVALRISGLLDPVTALLESAALHVGTTRISVLMVITTVATVGALIWVALFSARLFEQSLSRFPGMNPSAQVLLGKVTRISLITFAFLMAMGSLGINLTALAVLGGALGVGIGFGLQKIVSNLISGVILLMDRSIKPGDVIEVGETYGWINKLAARYTSVITRDGREHLIPNEDMITLPVINWTYSSTKVRRHVPIPISYKADLHQVMKLVLEAAAETPRVLDDPDPKCLVLEFGESVIMLDLRIWIADPHNGVRNVASDVLIRVWDKFRAENIDFPMPRRDVHVMRRDEDKGEGDEDKGA